ncbi:MAG: 3-keto-disaccharide hydrolase, partial [Akkermansiaceae bacterium]
MDLKKVVIFVLVSVFGQCCAGELDSSQTAWVQKYSTQENAPKPGEMLLNTEKEPELENGFVSLLNGKDLSNW